MSSLLSSLHGVIPDLGMVSLGEIDFESLFLEFVPKTASNDL